MKKEDVASIIVYVLMIALAFILGFTVVKDMVEKYRDAFTNGLHPLIFSLIVIVVGILINAFGLEVGHVLGGKIGGYSIVSFNVLGMCWYKSENGKVKFQFRDFNGLTGETVLAPKKDKPSPKMYVWLPLLMYLLELIICIVIYSVGSPLKTDTHSPLIWLGTAAIIIVGIASMMALYNFIPVKLDSMTDGYRLTLISKPVNVEAYNELMRIENLQREGKEIGDIKVFDEVTDFTASLNLMTVYDCLAKQDYHSALKLIDKMIECPDKISSTTKNRLIAQKVYINILTMKLDDAKKYYDDEVGDEIRRFISNDLSMESIRAYILIAGMLDESIGEVQFASSRKPKALKRSLKSRAKIEEKLYADALNMIKENHKDWDFTGIE